jgi:mono/diheme cytochrome c family protein
VAIRLECNLCHSIPQIVRPGEIEPMLPLATGIEPASHLDSTWISRHHNELNETCANCHTVQNAGGTTDTSFCSNSGCHGVDWRFAGFDAPSLAIELGVEQEPEEEQPPTFAEGELVTYQALQPILEQTCGQCHGATPTKGLRVTDYESLMAGSENGPVIVPGSPDESRIIEVLTGGHFAQLSDDQLALLRQWIADGAPEGETTAEPTSEETPQPEPTPKGEEAVEPTLESEEPSEITPEASPAGPAFSWGEVTPTPTEVTSEGFSWGD